MIDGPDGRITYSASDGHESDSFWIFAAILDGMATTTLWAPLDTVGSERPLRLGFVGPDDAHSTFMLCSSARAS